MTILPERLTVGTGAAVALFAVPPTAAVEDLGLLSDDECARAARFFFERDRAAFVTSRAALRRTLAGELSCHPADVRLITEANGRPALDQSHSTAIDFNVSHSGRLAAVALAHGGRIGVDIEWHRGDRGIRELVPTVMGARERELLLSMESDDAFLETFYACWTRKEAIVKGIGIGIAADLPSIDIPWIPSDGIVTVASTTTERWWVATHLVDASYTLSVALAVAPGASVCTPALCHGLHPAAASAVASATGEQMTPIAPVALR